MPLHTWILVTMMTMMTLSSVSAEERVFSDFSFEGIAVGGGLLSGVLPSQHGLRTQGGLKRALCGRHFLLAVPALLHGDVTVSVKDDEDIITSWEIAVPPRQYKETHIEGLPQAKVTPDPAALKRIGTERDAMREARAEVDCFRVPQLPLRVPAHGRVSGVFGSRRVLNGQPRARHLGLDIAAPQGTPIVAADGGIVRLARHDLFFTGHTIIVDHGLGLFTLYSHLHEISVTQGQSVQRGDVIGSVGATGRVTGPHLHWAVYLNFTAIDPALVSDLPPALADAAIQPPQTLPQRQALWHK